MNPKYSNHVIPVLLSGGTSNKPESGKVCLYSLRSLKGLVVSQMSYDLILGGCFDKLPDRLFLALMYHEILIPSDENEVDFIIDRKLNLATDFKKKSDLIALNSGQPHKPFLADYTFPFLVSNELEAASFSSHRATARANIRDYKLILHNPVKNWLDHLPLEMDENVNLQILVTPDETYRIDELTELIIQLFETKHFFLRNKITIHYQCFDDQWDKEKLQSLLVVQSTMVRIVLYPTSTIFFDLLHTLGKPIDTLPTEHFHYRDSDSVEPLNDLISNLKNGYEGAQYRFKPFDEAMRRSIKNGELSCTKCVYLPACGGCVSKTSSTAPGCPTFIQDIQSRVRLKYLL